MIKILGAHHVGICVSSMDRSLAWYKDILGFEIRSQAHVPDRGLKIAFIRCGDLEIELFEREGSIAQRPAETNVLESFQYQGYRHFAFRVADVDATYADLEASGQTLAIPPTTNEALGVRYCFIQDPDGVLLEFLSPLN